MIYLYHLHDCVSSSKLRHDKRLLSNDYSAAQGNGWMQILKHELIQFSSVAQSCPTVCNPMNCSTPGLPVHHQLPEFGQTHVHGVGDATQPSQPGRLIHVRNWAVQFTFHNMCFILWRRSDLEKKEQASGWGNGAAWQSCLQGKVHGFSACLPPACTKANKENPEGSSLYKRKGYLEKRRH